MIDLHLRVLWNGEKVEVTDVKGSDLVALERQFSIALPSLRGFTFEQACFLVWRVLRRDTTREVGAFDDTFLDGIEDLEQLDVPLEDTAGQPSPAT